MPPFPVQDTMADKLAWTTALQRAITVAQDRASTVGNTADSSGESKREDGADTDIDPSLEAEGIMFKRAFAPGKRGKWLR